MRRATNAWPTVLFTLCAPNERDDFLRVLDPAASLDAARHIHGPWPHLANRLPHACAREAAGKNERDRRLARDARPVERLPGAARQPGHMRIEKQRPRAGESTCIF